MKLRFQFASRISACLIIVALIALFAAPPQAFATSSTLPFGYGFSVSQFDAVRAGQLGFNWVEVYGPPRRRLPTKVLYRVPLSAADWSNQSRFRARLVTLSYYYGSVIDAFEIGNEVNLQSGWGAPPEASKYVDLLCVAQSALHLYSPGAKIVSAGLATVGRIPGSWNGHLGHDGTNQDEREYVMEFLSGGGMQCADAVGYHPLGFRAAYSAAPDINGGTPDTDCSSGLCFRSMEKFAGILQANGVAQPRIWATEMGWLTGASSYCQNNDPGWQGRAWQVVTPEQQAANLVGAFSYARAHWPWLEAMFVFNLDFNTAYNYQDCEQMRYYSIVGRPAESALAAMDKGIKRALLPLIASSTPALFEFQLSDVPRPWPNCGSMGIFGIVSDSYGGRLPGVTVQIYAMGGAELTGGSLVSTTRSDDRNYEFDVSQAGQYQVALYDPASHHEISPRVNVSIVDRSQCDIQAGELAWQWIQVNFQHN